MYSRRHLQGIAFTVVTAALGSYSVPVSSADDFSFTVVPDKCISLVKDQVCYQRVQFRWQSRSDADAQERVCLWREGGAVALNCWSARTEGEFRYALEASETTGFYLVAGDQQQPIVASTEVKVTWVYNKRSSGRTRWRLF